MTILSLWKQNKEIILDKTIDQILSFCGTGKLSDDNKTSLEFRDFLRNVPTKLLQKYAEECLNEQIHNSGYILQDIINQIGSRLGYKVEYGLYRGKKNNIGFDGIWTAENGHEIVIEVKTTDAYRINLDTIATYRTKLIENNRINKNQSSILIIVGRQDTGDLEAQIRGSRHAWDIRLISTDALIKLMFLKENLNDTRTFQKINQMLKPMEYTKIDPLIDIILDTTEDLQLEVESNHQKIATNSTISHQNSSSSNFHELCIDKIEKHLDITLVKQGKTIYTSSNNLYHIVSVVSKRYDNKDSGKYWFSFHPSQQKFLEETINSYIAFGCGSENQIILMPYKEFLPLLGLLGQTKKKNSHYWHVEFYEKQGIFTIRQSHVENADVTKYLI